MIDAPPPDARPSLAELLQPLADSQAPMKRVGAEIFARACLLKAEFDASRKRRIEVRKDGGLPTPICKLNLFVRFRDGRPSMEWRRTTHRRESRVFTRSCAPEKLTQFTNEVDHDLVVGCEGSLKQLRKLWGDVVLVRRRIDAFLKPALKLIAAMDAIDERDHLPIAPARLGPTGPSANRRGAQAPSTILEPTQFPAIRSDD